VVAERLVAAAIKVSPLHAERARLWLAKSFGAHSLFAAARFFATQAYDDLRIIGPPSWMVFPHSVHIVDVRLTRRVRRRG